VPKKVLQFAGIEDVFTSSRGSTKTLGNFVKVMKKSSFAVDSTLRTTVKYKPKVHILS
jgi:ribosomal protein S5